jgi:hypothetical protein
MALPRRIVSALEQFVSERPPSTRQWACAPRTTNIGSARATVAKRAVEKSARNLSSNRLRDEAPNVGKS